LVQKVCAYRPKDRLRTFEELKAELDSLRAYAERRGAGDALLHLEEEEDLSFDSFFGKADSAAQESSMTPGSPDADFYGTNAAAPGPTGNSRGTFFCRMCGKNLSAGARFCPFCGSQAESGVYSVGAAPLMQNSGCGMQNPASYSASAYPTAHGARVRSDVCVMKTSTMSDGNGAESLKPASPVVELTRVQFSAVAPRTLLKGDYTVIDIVMYEETYRHMVDEIIREAETPVRETRSGVMKVKEGAEVRIRLTSPDLEIEDNEETQQWQGGYLDFSFAVMLPEHYRKRQILFTATVYINNVIATRLKFTAKCSTFFQQKIAVSREDILSAFVSYASQDRNRVAAIVQGMQKARPDMDIFFDVDSLRSGEDWERALHHEIENRDVLYLCWSHYARESRWVDTEWRYALDYKGLECIEPIPIDPPDICPPPEELQKKHFNDKLLYIINSDQSDTR